MRTSPRPYGGSSVYIALVNRGEVPLAFNTSLDLARAYRGFPPFAAPQTELRVVARMFVLYYGFVVRASSDIYRIEDLRGRRVVYEIRSGVSLTPFNDTVLATGGLSVADIVPIAAGHVVQSVGLLIEGRADAAVAGFGIAEVQRAHASIPGGVRMVALGALGTDAFVRARTPGAKVAVARPSPNNVGFDEPMQAASFDTYLTSSTSMSADDVYRIARTLHTNWAVLQRDYPALRSLQNHEIVTPNSPVPYHDGAVRFFRDAGIWPDTGDD